MQSDFLEKKIVGLKLFRNVYFGEKMQLKIRGRWHISATAAISPPFLSVFRGDAINFKNFQQKIDCNHQTSL